ncbi:hypothetical protein H8E52_06755 [bacterium]|nr:hypothetical protein [bacterium]
MKKNLKALTPLMIILMVAVAAQERPAQEDLRGNTNYTALAEAASPDSLAPAAPLPVKTVDQNPGFLQRSKIAARSLAITLRVGKRLLGHWLETFLSQPTRKG